MSSNRSGSSQLTEPVSGSETRPLLAMSESVHITFRERLARAKFSPRLLCLPSKAAVLILFWTLTVSAIYKTASDGTVYTAQRLRNLEERRFRFLSVNDLDILLTYLVFVLLLLLYPLAGFIADVCCGRYKAVIVSLCLLLCGLGCLALNTSLMFLHVIRLPFNDDRLQHSAAVFYLLSGLGLLFMIPGLSSYQANYIQLGLDQLLEAPSEYLGLFVHWVEWFTEVGRTLLVPIFFLLFTCKNNIYVHHSVLSLSLIFFVVLLLLLIFSCWKRRWFYSEPGSSNPYKTVFKVLNFTRKHKHPLRRSAFTFADDEEPTRIDFAKERYGGPFTTEQVEDVKTFLRILAVLLVLGPTFFTEIPMGPVYHAYVNHTSGLELHDHCSLKPILKDMVFLKNLATIVMFPIYIWFIYSVLRRCIPKILVRLWMGEASLVCGMMAMFLIDLFGHVKAYTSHHQTAACMFIESSTKNQSGLSFNNQSAPGNNLNLPWTVNLLPALLMQVGLTLVLTTSFEFISAQSPHSMKGLLIGLLYAIRGMFKFLGAMSILPFSLKVLWKRDYIREHPPSITNCGFGYLLFNVLVSSTGLVLFTIAAKRYRYRERDDPPYNQATVETVWAN